MRAMNPLATLFALIVLFTAGCSDDATSSGGEVGADASDDSDDSGGDDAATDTADTGGDDAVGDATGEPDGGGALANCTINFDGSCPDSSTQCGATVTGGNTCRQVGLGNCYESGVRGFDVLATGDPATFVFEGDVNAIDVFFAGQDAGDAGTMTFFDASNNEVGTPLDTNGMCGSTTMLLTQRVNFATPVRRIVVAVTAGSRVWVDSLEVNPGS